MEAAMLLEQMGEEDTSPDSLEMDEEMKMKQIKSLAKKFFGAPSAKGSIDGADMSLLVLEKWLKKLGVGWVLHFADGAAAGKLKRTLDVSSWTRAVFTIKHALGIAVSLLPCHGSSVKEEGPAATDIMTDRVQIASFAQQAILKLIAFVDFIDVPNLNITWPVSTIQQVAPPYQKLYAMLRVYNAPPRRWRTLPLPRPLPRRRCPLPRRRCLLSHPPLQHPGSWRGFQQ
jgi:hypothetical protein